MSHSKCLSCQSGKYPGNFLCILYKYISFPSCHTQNIYHANQITFSKIIICRENDKYHVFPPKFSSLLKGRPSGPNRLFFLTLFKRPLTPSPPSFLNIYVADFSKGLLKKCVKACRDKCVKIVD